MFTVRFWLLVVAVTAIGCSKSSTDQQQPPKSATANPPAPAPAPDDRYSAEALGALTFTVSDGTPAARAHFTRGLLAMHSFWYDEAKRQFQAAIDADPKMNMAYWGLGMSHCMLLWGDDDVEAARTAISRMPAPDRLTEREMAWVLAAVALLKAPDVRTSRIQFKDALEALHAKYPDDESATFLAAALLSTIRPGEPDALAIRKRAAELALSVYSRNPKHPGAAHYLIHAYDIPELASLALPQARTYAQIAPAAFHARHMPAHIFSRLGMWEEALASCKAAWEASTAAAQREKLSADHHDFHSLTWLIEMSFEVGHRKQADDWLAVFANTVRSGLDRKQRGLYASQVTSYMMRTGAWSRVDELLAPLDTPAVEQPDAASPFARAGSTATHCAPAPQASPFQLMETQSVLYARAHAAAFRRDTKALEQHLARLTEVRAQLRPFMETMLPKEELAKLDAADARKRSALLARSRGKAPELLRVLRESLTDSDANSGGESNPSGFVTHEQIGELLLEQRQAKEAASHFALALAAHPRRARSLLGAARAAKLAGDAGTARDRYRELLALWSSADPGTEGLDEARAGAAAP